jgi:hypothetical protein
LKDEGLRVSVERNLATEGVSPLSAPKEKSAAKPSTAKVHSDKVSSLRSELHRLEQRRTLLSELKQGLERGLKQGYHQANEKNDIKQGIARTDGLLKLTEDARSRTLDAYNQAINVTPYRLQFEEGTYAPSKTNNQPTSAQAAYEELSQSTNALPIRVDEFVRQKALEQQASLTNIVKSAQTNALASETENVPSSLTESLLQPMRTNAPSASLTNRLDEVQTNALANATNSAPVVASEKKPNEEMPLALKIFFGGLLGLGVLFWGAFFFDARR